ncbi:MAG: hypothetical protein OER21_00455 [Gemmatimonadota bacterium]|nr:hypothetical protein [Gemmatimonadota bacterium]
MSTHIPRLAAVLALAALIALPVATTAQAPRVQHFPFGGGSHFEFLIPVQANGPLAIKATWATNETVEALLFAPGKSRPVARAEGQGTVQLAHRVGSWRAGDQWLLKLVTRGTPTLRGDVQLVWPAGNRPGSVVAWRNAGPTDPETRIAIANKIRQLEETFAATALRSVPASAVRAPVDAVARRDMRNLLAALATRLQVLDELPPRYIENEPAPTTSDVLRIVPVGTAAEDGMTVRLLELLCLQSKPWHVDHESDRPYVAVAVLHNGDGPAATAHSPVYRFVHAGDAPVASAAGAPLVDRDGLEPMQVAVALFEQEDGDTERAVERFQHAVELYQLYVRLNGGTDDAASFTWFLSIVNEMRDDVLGTPQLLVIRPTDGASAQSTIETLDFASHESRYRVVLKVAAANHR